MIIEKLKKLLIKHGFLGVIRIIFLPLNLIWGNTIRLLITLYHSRYLADGKWSNYPGYRPKNSINSLYYWTEALNLDRYGRSGVSNYVSTGNYRLSNWWHLSLTSIYLYRHIGVLLPIICMFGFLGFHLLWLQSPQISANWLFVVLTLTLLSSYFYANAFVSQNYNVLGWLFMPLGMYGLLTGNYYLAGFAWLAASLGSFTVVFLASCLTVAYSLFQMTFLPMLALLPALLKLASHLLYLDSPLTSIKNMADGIGLTGKVSQSLKYKRAKKSPINLLIDFYFIVIWSIFATFIVLSGDGLMGWLTFVSIGLFMLNTFIARFADDQSMHMLIFCVATVAVLNCSQWWILVLYWLTVSPPPFIIGSATINDRLEFPRAYKPFNVESLLEKANNFIRQVPQDSRVILSLKDPMGDYNRIFDGYRSIYELVFFVSSSKKFLIFPDWWAVFEHNNDISSPNIWGTEPEQVIKNCYAWQADHVLIYQEAGTELDSKWMNKNFELISEFDWSKLGLDEFEIYEIFAGRQFIPKWFLLKNKN